jgi:CRP-like cAMP-binding protein
MEDRATVLPGDLPAHPRIGSPIPSTLMETRLNGERPPEIPAVCPFRLVDDDDMAQLDREITMIDAAAGSTLFEEGDPADGVAAILEGRVEILKQGRVLATLGPGSVLGELSIFVPSGSRTATARATSPVRMIKWRADDVLGRLARHERLATSIVADMAFVLAERLDRRTQDVVSLLKAAGTRLPVAELERFRSRAVE